MILRRLQSRNFLSSKSEGRRHFSLLFSEGLLQLPYLLLKKRDLRQRSVRRPLRGRNLPVEIRIRGRAGPARESILEERPLDISLPQRHVLLHASKLGVLQ